MMHLCLQLDAVLKLCVSGCCTKHYRLTSSPDMKTQDYRSKCHGPVPKTVKHKHTCPHAPVTLLHTPPTPSLDPCRRRQRKSPIVHASGSSCAGALQAADNSTTALNDLKPEKQLAQWHSSRPWLLTAAQGAATDTLVKQHKPDWTVVQQAAFSASCRGQDTQHPATHGHNELSACTRQTLSTMHAHPGGGA